MNKYLFAVVCLMINFFTIQGWAQNAASERIATFDSFAEGDANIAFTDGGITFSDLDERSGPAQHSFSIEGTDRDQFGPYFSPPNYLTTGGFSLGPEFSFGRFGSAKIKLADGSKGMAAIVEIFDLGSSNNILTLQALLDGKIVAADSIAFKPFSESVRHQTLVVYGAIFDDLRLVASGPDDSGVVSIGIDNVRITPLPLCFGLPATIIGTPGNNILWGTLGDDVIAGLGGNDVINGLGGNDRICGGPGDDTLDGSIGNDQLDGGLGRDICINGTVKSSCP